MKLRTTWEGNTLTEYIENLLKLGKRSKDTEFQSLFAIYGQERITKMAQEALKKLKEKKK